MSYDYEKTKFERKHIVISQKTVVFINIEQIKRQNNIWDYDFRKNLHYPS